MSKVSKIGFSLTDIATLQFAIIEEAFNEKESVNLNLSSKFVSHGEDHAITCVFKIQFTQKTNPFIILETGCHFSISPEAWEKFLDEEKKMLILPRDFASHLLMLNIGTARGVLHSKLEGTFFSNLILPTINVTKLITDEVKVAIKEENTKES